jgi:uncharacterized protein DUF2844
MTAMPSRLSAAAGALAIVLQSAPAFATLGGPVSSVQDDQVRLQGAIMRVTPRDAFTVHEMRAPAGTMIREYVSPSGTVFGVAWDGPTIPDLRQVLGEYFTPYVTAAQSAKTRHAGRGPVRIEEPTFVVEQTGHPRAFAGRAYLPRLIPAGIRAEAIR